jgi:phage portal protein BeeE
MYYSQCLQTLMTSLETALDEGLELPAPYGTEFDIEDLYYLDTPTRTKAAHDAIASGALSPNEARARYFDVGPVEGGDSPFLQMQYWSLAQLASREAPGPAPAVLPQPAPAADGDDDEDEENEEKEFLDTLTTSLGVLDAA